MRSSTVLVALAGVAVAHEGHTLTVTQQTTITVISCASAPVGSCTHTTVTVPVTAPVTDTPTAASSTSVVKVDTAPVASTGHSTTKVETATQNTTLVEVPTTAAHPPVATYPAPVYPVIYPVTNLTTLEANTTTVVTTASEGTGHATTVPVASHSASGANSTPSAPPQVGAGARVVISGVMLGLMALGAAFFA